MKQGEKTKLKILNAGLLIWQKNSSNVTARAIARYVGFTHTNVLYHFNNSENMRNCIAAHAVEVEDSSVIAQLIATNHPAIKNMSKSVRNRHLNAVSA